MKSPTPGSSDLPNVVVVVLDCVRAWDFPEGTDSLPGMPFLEGLRKECVTFPRAASVSSWTVPSHASLFTGRYPWEHGTHGKGSLALRNDVPRLPQMLRTLGYRTASLSANVLVCGPSGLLDGFDTIAWGSVIDLFTRLENRTIPPHPVEKRGGAPGSKLGVGDRVLSRLPQQDFPLRSIVERHLSIPVVVGRAWKGVKRVDRQDLYSVARWIEPSFEELLQSTDQRQPVFCFFNFCDAHEPYFPWPEAVRGPELLWRWMRTRQDRPGWLARESGDGIWDLNLLHRLYRASIRSMDHRIQRVVESLQRHGRWDNTLLVITSDHGQAFGEKGMLYHRFRVDESLVRIPLWVRFPGKAHANQSAVGWASLVDIVPTVLESIGEAPPNRLDGRSLVQMIDRPRPEPVLAIADGTLGERWIPASRLAELNRVAVAAFTDAFKVTYTATPDEVHAYNILQDPREEHDVWAERSAQLGAWSDLAKNVAMKLSSAPPSIQSPELLERLRGWGYA